jgi:hypothetical protein
MKPDPGSGSATLLTRVIYCESWWRVETWWVFLTSGAIFEDRMPVRILLCLAPWSSVLILQQMRD